MPEEALKPAKQRSALKFFEFGPYRVDAAKRVLLRNGEPVPLPPKAFETLLRLLVENGIETAGANVVVVADDVAQ